MLQVGDTVRCGATTLYVQNENGSRVAQGKSRETFCYKHFSEEGILDDTAAF